VGGLDLDQADAARTVAGDDALVVVEGPAGTGKTTMLTRAVTDLTNHARPVFGVAPTAKAARVLEAETRIPTDTVAKLLHEHTRVEGPVDHYQLPAGTTLIVDEAGMLGTTTMDQLTTLADRYRWRVVLVGDPNQLQAVGRGGLFAEVCALTRVQQLGVVHRFTQRWEQTASLQLRHGHLTVLDDYEQHGRITAGSFEKHLERVAADWVEHHQAGRTVAVTATTNSEVDHINSAIQQARLAAGHLDPDGAVGIAGGELAHVGELVTTRRNDRTLTTDTRDMVRNRDRWYVTATHPDGQLTLTGKRSLARQLLRCFTRPTQHPDATSTDSH